MVIVTGSWNQDMDISSWGHRPAHYRGRNEPRVRPPEEQGAAKFLLPELSGYPEVRWHILVLPTSSFKRILYFTELFFFLSKYLTMSHSQNLAIKCLKPKSLLQVDRIVCTFPVYRSLFQTTSLWAKPDVVSGRRRAIYCCLVGGPSSKTAVKAIPSWITPQPCFSDCSHRPHAPEQAERLQTLSAPNLSPDQDLWGWESQELPF